MRDPLAVRLDVVHACAFICDSPREKLTKEKKEGQRVGPPSPVYLVVVWAFKSVRIGEF